MGRLSLTNIFLLASAIFAISFLPSGVNATALTYNMEANENACFYTWADTPGKKIGFYFAVNIIILYHLIKASIYLLKHHK